MVGVKAVRAVEFAVSVLRSDYVTSPQLPYLLVWVNGTLLQRVEVLLVREAFSKPVFSRLDGSQGTAKVLYWAHGPSPLTL